MRRRPRRTHSISTLIFVALVALVGAGLIASGDYYDPTLYLRDISQIIPRSAQLVNVLAQPTTNQRYNRRPDPPAQDQNDFQWSLFIAPLFDLWMLAAITACYILVHETLGWLMYRVRARGALVSPVNSVNASPAPEASEEDL